MTEKAKRPKKRTLYSPATWGRQSADVLVKKCFITACPIFEGQKHFQCLSNVTTTEITSYKTDHMCYLQKHYIGLEHNNICWKGFRKKNSTHRCL